MTKDRTNYMLVKAEDSAGLTVDHAIVEIDEKVLTSIKCAMEIYRSFGSTMPMVLSVLNIRCTYLEIEEANPDLYERIQEMKEGKDWDYGFIDEELYDELIESCEMNSASGGFLTIGEKDFSFEIFDEYGIDGYFVLFRTSNIPFAAIL